ncbi:MAG: transcriptional regulator [Bacteroidales bacterium]|nr:transcriptional regulator [Bacteroidales bacterium]
MRTPRAIEKDAGPAHRPPSYVSCATLARELDVSESTVWDMVRRGVLPKPIKLSAGCVRWSWTEVQAALGSLSSGGDAAAVDPFLAGARNATSSA